MALPPKLELLLFCVSRLVRDDEEVLNRVAEQVGRNLKPCNENKSIIALGADEA